MVSFSHDEKYAYAPPKASRIHIYFNIENREKKETKKNNSKTVRSMSSGYGYILSIFIKERNWIRIYRGENMGEEKRRGMKIRTKDNTKNAYSCWHKIELLPYFFMRLYQIYNIKSNRIV